MKQPPFHLNEITLKQWVAYQNLYGDKLEDNWKVIVNLPNGEEKQNALLLHDVDLHQKYYSFFTGTPLPEVLQMPVVEVIKLQGAAFISHKKEQLSLDVFKVWDWNGEKWKIAPIYKVKNRRHQLTEEEYYNVNDIALIYNDLAEGKNEALYELCAAYMRHPGEPYSTDLMYDRRHIMPELPLDMALCVRKYNLDAINEVNRLNANGK